MSPRSQALTGRYLFSSLAVLALALIASNAPAQDQAVPTPKWEVFAGYSWAHPGGTVIAPLRDQPIGYGVSLTRDLNRWFGLTADLGGHYNTSGSSASKANSALHTFMFGPRLNYRGSDRFVPFAEALVGITRLTPDGFEPIHAFGLAAGGGLDIDLTNHFAVRLVQADYEYAALSRPSEITNLGRMTNLQGVRLQTGIVWMMGGHPANVAPPAASCSLQPNEVMTGEPVKVTASASNFPKKATLSYSWSSSGGKVSGTGDTATVDTTGLAGGSYNVTAKVTDNKKSNAQCTSSFTVKEPAKNPPTVSCSANPATVRSGESSTISCDCKSPDNRPVTLSNWTASSGRVSGTGNTATLDTAGVSPGSVTVGATCSDDRGLSATANAAVNVEAPPEKPVASKLTDIPFKKNNARVNNDAKGALDGVADRLLQDPNAKAVIVGETAAGEKGGTRLAAQRAVNAKAYLTSGENQKAVDGSRIEVRSGTGDQRAEIYIVPEGATFDTTNTQAVDETKVKPQARHAAAAPARHKRAAKKKAATP